VGFATRAKLILCERYHTWPLADGPQGLTAAQVSVLFEALKAPDAPDDPDAPPKPLKTQPKLSRAQLLAIAAGGQAQESAAQVEG
jgi:hypothetical protein